jgi:hypothetical protein
MVYIIIFIYINDIVYHNAKKNMYIIAQEKSITIINLKKENIFMILYR